jgi:hypothetical protein
MCGGSAGGSILAEQVLQCFLPQQFSFEIPGSPMHNALLLGGRMAGFGTAPSQDTVMAAQIQRKMVLEQRLKGGASWFYWICGLSLINTVIVLSGSNWHFLAGLGITDIISYVAQKGGSAGTVVGIIGNALALGIFVLLGVFAHKRQTWAFIVGMTIYGLDALIFLFGPDILSIGFHAFALFQIFKGMQAGNALTELEKQMPQTIVATP